MFGWIESVLSDLGHDIASGIVNLIRFMIRGLYSFLHDLFSATWNAWGEIWNGVHDLWAALWNFGEAVYAKLFNLIRILIPWLTNLVNWVYQTAIHYATAVFDDLSSWMTGLYNRLVAFVNAMQKWVITDIWDPLSRTLSPLIDWIAREGATMWHYFTHLDDLAELLFWYLVNKLEKYAWDAARVLGQFFLALIVRNLVQFITLIEDVINAVL